MRAERLTRLLFDLFLFFVMVFSLVWITISDWNFYSALMPMVFSIFGVVMTGAVVLRDLLVPEGGETGRAEGGPAQDIDTVEGEGEDAGPDEYDETFGAFVPPMLMFFSWLVAFYIGIVIIGFLPAVAIATIAFLRIFGTARWLPAAIAAVLLVAASYYFYDTLMHVVWPDPLIMRLLE
ncbi:tripartite tricarboxylate transporter TctB family protein [Celeribacter indicus]|uniref:DUF1468 domain-containing protein n=1 Tax=Celeribacter indicus TaxID=1208324 RepID=A0A0B5E0N1_9RHOB|nr:tripartite tricarboxylate transporter TctB family protein [Celeribacter indicus]AJE48824.1 hypothetical protein P73_4109 [Celeribacter indicus]SDW38409.1 Tripartite tricarboxylate transporter TctB family protein [Celeribacter indicus]